MRFITMNICNISLSTEPRWPAVLNTDTLRFKVEYIYFIGEISLTGTFIIKYCCVSIVKKILKFIFMYVAFDKSFEV